MFEDVLRARHLAWVARQEEADRQRAVEKARREQQAVQQQARAITDQIGEGLARIQRLHATAAAAPSAPRDTLVTGYLGLSPHSPSRCGG